MDLYLSRHSSDDLIILDGLLLFHTCAVRVIIVIGFQQGATEEEAFLQIISQERHKRFFDKGTRYAEKDREKLKSNKKKRFRKVAPR